MDILASIIAYLGCMTAIVGALLISFVVLFSSPDQLPSAAPTSGKPSVAMAARPGAPKVTAAIVARPAAKLDRHLRGSPSITQGAALPQTKAASVHAKILAARAQKMRRFVQEERARRWAYQQDLDFESRFLGYAD